MPAYNDTRDFGVSDEWVLVTASDVTAITFKNLGAGTLWVAATAGATPPSSRGKAIPVASGEGESNLVLAEAFPGVTGANRVYILAPYGGRGFFSHA